jgi:O-antigen ligase
LYLETLAELGVVGFILVVLLLFVPLAVALVKRHARITSIAVGAYVAYVVHAAADWDWELAGVTSLALAVGAVLVIGGSRADDSLGSRVSGRRRALILGAAGPLAAVVFYGWLGNSATSRAQDALDANHWPAALSNARRADRLMPWSPEPLLIESQALLGAGDRASARAAALAAVGRDKRNWVAWYDLALASTGRSRASALHRASALYPNSHQINDALKKLDSRQQ